eukprot:749832-Hanusia_phi.AAC.1
MPLVALVRGGQGWSEREEREEAEGGSRSLCDGDQESLSQDGDQAVAPSKAQGSREATRSTPGSRFSCPSCLPFSSSSSHTLPPPSFASLPVVTGPQAEHKYVSEETLFAKYQAEIKELEDKRDKLLQGLDCDVPDVADAEELKKTPTPSRKVKAEPSSPLRPSTSSSRTYPLSPARETLDDDDEEEEEEDLGEMAAAVEQEAIGGGGAEQDVWEMLHRMVAEENEDTLELNDQPKAPPPPAATQDAVASLPAGSSAQHGHQLPLTSSPADPLSHTGAGMDGTMDEYRDVRAQLMALQEEILHLRQFSMALLKERGDIAAQLQGRDEEISEPLLLSQLTSDPPFPEDLQQRCHSLESQLILVGLPLPSCDRADEL